MSDTKYCKDCKNINCPEGRVNCKYPDAIACDLYRDTPPTIFDLITASPETLAEKFVYLTEDMFGDITWSSTIFPGWYVGREDCIAATVAKLKEVEE